MAVLIKSDIEEETSAGVFPWRQNDLPHLQFPLAHLFSSVELLLFIPKSLSQEITFYRIHSSFFASCNFNFFFFPSSLLGQAFLDEELFYFASMTATLALPEHILLY